MASLVTSLLIAGLQSVTSTKPHIVFLLVDDYGWAGAGWHNDVESGGQREVQTPYMNELVATGIELNHHYTFKFCSPTRSSLQSGRNPIHVNVQNVGPDHHNPEDPVAGFSAIARNMTGMAVHLKAAGYATAAVGKWDAGMATDDHTPHGRGYEKSLFYFHHANDYWTQAIASSGPHACPDRQLIDLWNTTGPARGVNGTAYEEELFLENTMTILNRHDPREPLFLFHAFHQIHTPLQVPAAWEQSFNFLPNVGQRKYAAMVAYMDNSLGKIVDKLKERDMWSNTLLVVSSDNGGPNLLVAQRRTRGRWVWCRQ